MLHGKYKGFQLIEQATHSSLLLQIDTHIDILHTEMKIPGSHAEDFHVSRVDALDCRVLRAFRNYLVMNMGNDLETINVPHVFNQNITSIHLEDV